MEDVHSLNHLYSLEKSLGIHDITIKGVPLWRIVRYSTRLHYLTTVSGYVAGTSTVKTVGKRSFKLFSGFWHYIKKENLNVFFPFNRLVDNDGILIDKFVDPIIEESDIHKQSCVIVDSPNYRGTLRRVHRDICIQQENRTIVSQFLKYWYHATVRLCYSRQVNELFQKVKEPFLLNNDFEKKHYRSLYLFLANYTYYLFWFKIIKPKRVFVVLRESYFPVIAVCKRLGIPVAEFQHGITLDKTVSYTGDYDSRIDPDYFLTFGEFWSSSQFGMSEERTFCIGWAYSKYLSHKNKFQSGRHTKEILVISSPEITDSLLEALTLLSGVEGDYSFHIRLHPCEAYNEKQMEKLARIPNAQMVDNKQDSAIVLPTYKFVMGENSSVIYEAMSVECQVGMLNMCNLHPPIDLPGIKESFYIINGVEDFKEFVAGEKTYQVQKGGFYSDFINERFMDFVNKSM